MLKLDLHIFLANTAFGVPAAGSGSGTCGATRSGFTCFTKELPGEQYFPPLIKRRG